MALARVDKPAVLLYSGPQRAGRLGDRELTILDVWEAVAAHERGLMDRDELDAIERAACPGRRARAPGSSPRTRWRWRSTASGWPSPATG